MQANLFPRRVSFQKSFNVILNTARQHVYFIERAKRQLCKIVDGI